MKKPLRHVFDYLILSFLMAGAVFLTLLFNGNRPFQMITIISTSLLYVIWGILHHQKEGTLHSKVVLEYLLYVVLGTTLVIGLL